MVDLSQEIWTAQVGMKRKVRNKAIGVIDNGEFVGVNDKMSQKGGHRWEGELQGNGLIGSKNR